MYSAVLKDMSLTEEPTQFVLTFYFEVEGKERPYAHVVHIRKRERLNSVLSVIQLLYSGLKSFFESGEEPEIRKRSILQRHCPNQQ